MTECKHCAAAVPLARDAWGIADPHRYFCSMECAAMFGIKCAEQREIAAMSQARRERKATQ